MIASSQFKFAFLMKIHETGAEAIFCFEKTNAPTLFSRFVNKDIDISEGRDENTLLMIVPLSMP